MMSAPRVDLASAHVVNLTKVLEWNRIYDSISEYLVLRIATLDIHVQAVVQVLGLRPRTQAAFIMFVNPASTE